MRSPQTRRSIWLGALVAPMAAPTAFVLYALVSVLSSEGVSGLSDWPAAGLMYVFGIPVAYGTMIVLGLPYVLWLQRNGTLGWKSVCVGATVAGAASYPLAISLVGKSALPIWGDLLVGVGFGSICGLAFCAITQPKPHLSSDT